MILRVSEDWELRRYLNMDPLPFSLNPHISRVISPYPANARQRPPQAPEKALINEVYGYGR